MDMDELVKEYAEKLQKIYDEKTAGAYTFEGVLSEFARKASELDVIETIKIYKAKV